MGKPPKKHPKLPTPPPDPREIAHQEQRDEGAEGEERTERSSSGVSDKDREMFDYIESLHKSIYSKPSSAFVPSIVTEDAFDHLEKLYKLMEQMLELKEQNVKLHRKIRDLERINNLEKLYLKPETVDEEYPDLEKDVAFSEALLDSILQDPRNKDLPKYKNLRTSLLRKHRSVSVTDKPNLEWSLLTDKEESDRQSAVKSDKHSKVSKWTKVKAAFKWEKASNVGESKSQDSGIHVPINYETARYLRVPSTSEDVLGHSPGDSGAGVSTPGSISSASSNDDLTTGRSQFDDLRSSDEENSHLYIPHSKEFRQKHHSGKYHHRTPWAKMKDMINTRNSLRKKHRLSAASDDIQIDVELCSDTEDVFEDSGSKSTNMSLSPSPNVYSNSSTSPCESEIPPEIVERYQRALIEDSASASDSEARPSRWTRVRKAFLTGDFSRRSVRLAHMNDESGRIEEELRQSYKQLQKKLSLEFQEKVNEWERLKQNSPDVSHSSSTFGFGDEVREFQKSSSSGDKPRCVPMTRPYELPSDFKKKLQEWEKIKRGNGGGNSGRKRLGEVTKWKSLGGPRSSEHSPVFKYPALSDDFRKKLEEWRQIKASGGPGAYADQKKLKDKTPSPRLSRKNSSPKQSKKGKDPNRETHWFEKELSKIDKEKQHLEREKQKFIDREERLSVLRKSVLGAMPKKEILIHTPSGFHRFEGISRKFTQKLYEWEKSQGIAPEASTFALLTASSYVPDVRSNTKDTPKKRQTTPLSRSKSADSIVMSALNLACPILSGHPSSLSLNDIESLEKDCLAESKTSSMQFSMKDNDDLDMDEPEAVLVEVEDYEEETAEPLHVSCIERQQLPVYQREECKPLCETETIALPKVRKSESTRAQISYDLLEAITKLLNESSSTEDRIDSAFGSAISDPAKQKTAEFLRDLQTKSINSLAEMLQKLQEANAVLIKNITQDDKQKPDNLNDTLEKLQSLSADALKLIDQMKKVTTERCAANISHVTVTEEIKQLKSKLAEIRRHLSYICSATDCSRKISSHHKLEVRKTLSTESRESREDASDVSRKSSDKERRYVKLEGGASASTSQGAVKKRIRHRQKTIVNKSLVDTDDEEDNAPDTQRNVRQHKKLTRMRSMSEGGTSPQFDPKLVAPTTKESVTMPTLCPTPSESAVTLFVKTTRKLFTPIIETSLAKSSTEPSIHPGETVTVTGGGVAREPVPPSPVPQRKVYKEVSPGIKMIMAKYNQNVEQSSGVKSGCSSGTNSPTAWQSPASERRVKGQTDKYQQGLKNLSPVLGVRNSSDDPPTPTSSDYAKEANARRNLTLDISLANEGLEVRMRRIQKAKEEFLKMPVSAPSYISDELLQYPQRNRLSQISVESESSDIALPGSLVKSASAGMINIDPDIYSKIDPEFRAEGYVSLPRHTKSPSGKSAFSSIASKFRKVKMRRNKNRESEKNKQTVATLCRQSLVVDINDENNVPDPNFGNNNGDVRREERSDSISSSLTKSKSWIKRSFFKK